jgi:hypothetical protein
MQDPPAGGRWEVTRFELPVDIAGKMTAMHVVAVVHAPTGLALGHEAGPSVDAEVLANALNHAAEGAKQGGFDDVTHLRTSDPALAAELAALRPDLTVEVGPTPGADAVRVAMGEHFAPDDFELTWLGGKDVGPKEIKALFSAGADFRKLRPWEHLSSDIPLRLDIDALHVVGCAASVISDDGTGGLSLFLDPDGMVQMLTNRVAPGQAPGDMIAVVFYRKAELPPDARKQLRRLSTFAKRGPYPMLIVTDPAGRRQAPDELHYTIATAALQACGAFLTELAEQAGPQGISGARGRALARTTRGELTVDLTLPHELLNALDGDDFDDDALMEGLFDASMYEGAVHRLKISLKGAKPPIWRRVEVDSQISLQQLHAIVQIAMGWKDSHLHMFETHHGFGRIGPAGLGLDDDLFEEDEADVPLFAALPDEGDKMVYVYDFGDDWRHEIVVEAIIEPDEPLPAPRVIKGRRACPPEDCGGIHMYRALLAGDPPPHVADAFSGVPAVRDPAALDLDAINRALTAFAVAR